MKLHRRFSVLSVTVLAVVLGPTICLAQTRSRITESGDESKIIWSPPEPAHARAPRSPLSCISAPSGLVSWWPGDGNADDIADANPGTLVGSVTFAPGKVGQAFRHPTSINNIAAESGFYDFEVDEQTFSIEKTLEKLESETGSAFNKLFNEKSLAPLSNEDRAWISIFVASQHIRGRSFRESTKKIDEALI